MKLSTLTDEIRDRERLLAPGSETGLWSNYCEAVRLEAGVLPHHDHDDGIEVDDRFAIEWIERYARLKLSRI